MWTELEMLVSSSNNSPGHKAILQCIRECRSRGPEHTAEKLELEQALRELDPSSDAAKRASVIKATTDSPLSPPVLTDPITLSKMKNPFGNNGNR